MKSNFVKIHRVIFKKDYSNIKLNPEPILNCRKNLIMALIKIQWKQLAKASIIN